jgi:hypothetical protein
MKKRYIQDLSCGLGIKQTELKKIFRMIEDGDHVMAQNLLELAAKGIPIFHWLSEVLNCSIQQVYNKCANGEIVYSHFGKAISVGCDKGGMFYNAYKQAHSSNSYKLFYKQ